KRAGTAQPVDWRALAAETLPQPPRRIVGVVRDAQLLGAREEPTHQPTPDLPTVPGGDHHLSRDGHTDRLAPEQHATRHHPNEPPPPPPLVFLHQRKGNRGKPRDLGKKTPQRRGPCGPPRRRTGKGRGGEEGESGGCAR